MIRCIDSGKMEALMVLCCNLLKFLIKSDAQMRITKPKTNRQNCHITQKKSSEDTTRSIRIITRNRARTLSMRSLRLEDRQLHACHMQPPAVNAVTRERAKGDHTSSLACTEVHDALTWTIPVWVLFLSMPPTNHTNTHSHVHVLQWQPGV